MPGFRVFHSVQKAHAALFRAANRHLGVTEGISASQQAVLFVLATTDGAPIGAIARQLGMRRSSLSGLIDRMSERGLVRREADAADARVQNIFLEREGRDIVTRSNQTVHRINRRLLEGFDEAEQAAIRRFLEHLTDKADSIIASLPHDQSNEERKTA